MVVDINTNITELLQKNFKKITFYVDKTEKKLYNNEYEVIHER